MILVVYSKRNFSIMKSILKEKDYIIREGTVCYMWMNTKLAEVHKKYIYEQYSRILKLYYYIKTGEFFET